MMSIECSTCARVFPSDSTRCMAFPDGIPEEIITGQVSHKEPYKGDGGFQYEQSPLATVEMGLIENGKPMKI